MPHHRHIELARRRARSPFECPNQPFQRPARGKSNGETALAEHHGPQNVPKLAIPAGSTCGEFRAETHISSIRALPGSRIPFEIGLRPRCRLAETQPTPCPPNSPRECNPIHTQIVKLHSLQGEYSQIASHWQVLHVRASSNRGNWPQG